MDPHIFAHVNTECPDDKHAKLKIYISEPILDSYKYIPVVYVTMMHDSTLIKMTDARFVGTGGFLTF
jgi:hypothetical protein